MANQEQEQDKDSLEGTEQAGPPPCPHQKNINLYHEECPGLLRVDPKLWPGSQRETNLRARWREDPDRQHLDWWRWFFKEKVAPSDFLMGRVKDWQTSLEWLVQKKNFIKTLEGGYPNRKPRKTAGGQNTKGMYLQEVIDGTETTDGSEFDQIMEASRASLVESKVPER